MAYCVLDDVKALNPNRVYSADTKPTATQVAGFIDHISAQLDVILRGRGLAVPVTQPTDLLAYLKFVCALGAASLAEEAMFPTAGDAAKSAHTTRLQERYQAELEQLRKANLSTLRISPFSYGSEYPTEYDEGLPKFKYDKVF